MWDLSKTPLRGWMASPPRRDAVMSEGHIQTFRAPTMIVGQSGPYLVRTARDHETARPEPVPAAVRHTGNPDSITRQVGGGDASQRFGGCRSAELVALIRVAHDVHGAGRP